MHHIPKTKEKKRGKVRTNTVKLITAVSWKYKGTQA